MAPSRSNPVVHLELHTDDPDGASQFYEQLCGWPAQRLTAAGGTYRALGLGGRVDGGIVECAARRPLWLPYVEVSEISAATERARALGASVTLEPREGAAGWRSALVTPAGGELALWQPKR